MKSTDLAVKAYMQARKRMDDGYNRYIESCKKAGKNTVILYNDIEPFASLNETLFWAMSLYDMVKNNKEIRSDIRKFMSGLRFIINTMKHSVNVFDSYSFSHPGIYLSVKIDDTATGPVFEDVHLEPILIFSDFDGSNVPNNNRNQLRCYRNLIKGKSIPQTMHILDSYMQELSNSIS